MQSPISSFRDVQRMMRNEAGRSVLRQMAERYPYFLPLKAVNMLLKEEGTAVRELLHIYGVNPVMLHYLPYQLREQDATAKRKTEKPEPQPEIVEEILPELEEEKQEVESAPEISVEEPEIAEKRQPETVTAEQPEIEEKTPEIIGWQPAGTAVSTPEVVEKDAVKSDVEDSVVVSEVVTERPVSAPQKEPAPSSPAETPAEEPVIHPLYTRDYFKHQGVSIDENEGIYELKKPSGNDLMVMRSFAEWLRFFHSKKTKADEEQQGKSALKAMWQKGKLAAALEEEGEEIPEVVFEMAVKSISHEGNPATETMARIYLGQGKWEKAIDVYQQLQLRNPQKSAYFAEKIAAIEQQHRP